jgi:hypothetical protein
MEAAVGCLDVYFCGVYSCLGVLSSCGGGAVNELSEDSPINTLEEFFLSCPAVD